MKNILLAVTGLSPQVITETLYGMHQQGRHIDEVYIITTLTGKTRAKLGLLTDGNFQKLLDDYEIPKINFDESHIFCVENQGSPINDALSQDDHNAIADFITAKVRELTSDPEVAVHASIAGGRKTMTFYLGYAMSLFGRHQDTLSHVLVSSGYEGMNDFYYPSLESKTLHKGDLMLDAKEAEVILADIPFVRMRKEMPENLVNNPSADFSSTVSKLNLQKENITITLDVAQSQLGVNGEVCQLTPNQMATYCWFACELQDNPQGLVNPGNLSLEDCINYSRNFLKWALICGCDNKVFNGLGVEEKEDFEDDPENCHVLPMDKSKFESRTTLNKALANCFGTYVSELIGVHRLPSLSDENSSKFKRFGLRLAPENIQFP